MLKDLYLTYILYTFYLMIDWPLWSLFSLVIVHIHMFALTNSHSFDYTIRLIKGVFVPLTTYQRRFFEASSGSPL